ncbi:MAG: thioesterase family protein [Hyphomicrobiales bacterium]|nr:thioesterase family protein [Hyphomicrobiales bacterium]
MLSGEFQVRVYWGHCDPAKIVYYPNYFIWVDHAGHELLEKGGLDQLGLRKRYGLRGTVLGNVHAEFKSPAFFGDIIDVFSEVGRIGRSTFEIVHDVMREDTLLAKAKELRVWVVDDENSPTGIRAAPIPDTVRAVLEGRASQY